MSDAGRAGHGEPEPADHAERQPVDRPELGPGRANGLSESAGHEYVCEICGSPMLERHCKIVCPVCGYQRDCSDP